MSLKPWYINSWKPTLRKEHICGVASRIQPVFFREWRNEFKYLAYPGADTGWFTISREKGEYKINKCPFCNQKLTRPVR